jgi:hypothetical protein
MSNPNDPYDPRANPVPHEYPAAEEFGRVVVPSPGALRGAGEIDPVQPIGALQSATIKTLIAGLIVVLATFGVKLAWSDAQVQAVADGVIAFATVASTIGGIIFRIRAERKVVVGAKATDKSSTTTVVAFLGSLTVFGAAGGFTGGCAAMFPATATPVSRVYALKQAFNQAKSEITDAVNARMFDNRPDILRQLAPARVAVEDALATAQKFAENPQLKGDALFWIEAVDKALQHYVELGGSQNRSLPTTRPATNRTAWGVPPGLRRAA